MTQVKQFMTRHAARIFVGLPMVVALVYYLAFASERYVSEAKFMVRNDNNSGAPQIDLNFLGVQNSNNAGDALLLKEYILSNDMLSLLESTLGLRDHYQSHDADIFSRLTGSASREDFLSYYQNHVTVDFDEQSSILAVQVQTFTPAFSEKLIRLILQHSEAFINEIGHRLAGEHLNFVRKELDRAKEQLRNIKQDVVMFQDDHQMVSPEEQTRSVSSIISEMEADLAREEAHLKDLNGYLNKTAPDIVSSTNRIKALKEQITAERKRLAGRASGALNSLNSRFQSLNIDLEFAVDTYQASMAALANARVEASKKLKHLVVITTPIMAEESMYPRRLYILSTLFTALLMSCWLGSMILATINEHRE